MFYFDERRKYQRIEKPYIVRLRVKPDEGLEMPSSKWDMVPVRDISAGGLAFKLYKEFRFQFTLGF